VSGDWRLVVADLSSGGTHRLNRWGLETTTAALPTGTLTFNGEAVQAVSGPVQLDNAVNAAGDASFTGSHPLEFRGPVTLTGTRTLSVENTTVFSGAIAEVGGSAGLVKEGAGMLILTGNNTYTGTTRVRGGVLTVNGSIGSSPVIVSAGGIVAGVGTIGPLTLESGAGVSPGASPGMLAVGGDALWEGGGRYLWEINDALAGAGTGWDGIQIAGKLTLSATAGQPFQISLISLMLAQAPGPVHNFDPAQPYHWPLLTTLGGLSGFSAEAIYLDLANFANVLEGGTFSIRQNGDGLDLIYTPVPEPRQWALWAGMGLLTFAVCRRTHLIQEV